MSSGAPASFPLHRRFYAFPSVEHLVVSLVSISEIAKQIANALLSVVDVRLQTPYLSPVINRCSQRLNDFNRRLEPAWRFGFTVSVGTEWDRRARPRRFTAKFVYLRFGV